MPSEPEGFEVHEVDSAPKKRVEVDRLPVEEPKAIIETAAPEPVTKPYVMPRFAATKLIPKRTTTIKGPEPYEGVEITLWINPPDGEVTARAESSRNLADYMSHFVLDWSLTDDAGNKLPIEEASMVAFPKDLWDWMIQEFGEARMRPLVPPKNDDTTKNQTPRLVNLNRNQSLNGTT